jgi:hypothetical protein
MQLIKKVINGLVATLLPLLCRRRRSPDVLVAAGKCVECTFFLEAA